VVEHTHTDQLQRVAQLVGDRAVGGAGFGHAGGVVVGPLTTPAIL